MKDNEIILFENQGIKLEVNFKDETVWLNANQIAELFDRDTKTIRKHINNALKEELDKESTVANFATVQKEGNRDVNRDIEYYNLDMIISVGYRVKSKNGIIFRKFQNSIEKISKLCYIIYTLFSKKLLNEKVVIPAVKLELKKAVIPAVKLELKKAVIPAIK